MELPLFDTQQFDRDDLARRVQKLAMRGVFIGTSSWKYPGWRGKIYDSSRYMVKGRYSEARFERHCLEEFSGIFKTVCVDAAYYRFPEPRFIDTIAAQVPGDFRFTFKVSDEITVKRFANLSRHGVRAGQVNEHFLNADLFCTAFLGSLERLRDRTGVLIFEFSRFHAEDFKRGREFVEALDAFLGKLPKGWRYGVEIRNPGFLQPEYFAALARHNVTHVFNSWAAMPPIQEQWALPESRTADFCAARLLLKPGRKYQEAVDAFSPYDRIHEPLPEVRATATAIIREVAEKGKTGKAFIYVNNRLEGNALETIKAILDAH